ncbi:MAG: CopG family transcriptional regulator [Christensenellales bacterium]|jgi:hypothetical protein
MEKSVYSLVLMDDVVAAVDVLAYRSGTSRSNMINRILAEYLDFQTPEQRIEAIFQHITQQIPREGLLRIREQDSDTMLSVHSALQTRYNPTLRYNLELYPTGEELGQLRVTLRSQNRGLLDFLTLFFTAWHRMECRRQPNTRGEVGDGRYTRQLRRVQESNESPGEAITRYIAGMDTVLKAVLRAYQRDEDPATAFSQKLSHIELPLL